MGGKWFACIWASGPGHLVSRLVMLFGGGRQALWLTSAMSWSMLKKDLTSSCSSLGCLLSRPCPQASRNWGLVLAMLWKGPCPGLSWLDKVG